MKMEAEMALELPYAAGIAKRKKERKKEPPKPTNRKELRLVHVKKNHKDQLHSKKSDLNDHWLCGDCDLLYAGCKSY